jgi:CRP/FNR family cyclic AMP-dependent transcriptional regulator
MSPTPTDDSSRFDARIFLAAAGLAGNSAKYRKGAIVYAQGDRAENVLYIESGAVKLTVINGHGKQVVVAIFGRGEFFGEGCMAGQPRRIGTMSTVTSSILLSIDKKRFMKALHAGHGLADGFISFLLARNVRIEEDLIGQLFSSTEKRLARTLLLLARYGKQTPAERTIPSASRGKLASLVGVSRSRINFFMTKFRKLGFIESGPPLRINESLLTVVLYE